MEEKNVNAQNLLFHPYESLSLKQVLRYSTHKTWYIFFSGWNHSIWSNIYLSFNQQKYKTILLIDISIRKTFLSIIQIGYNRIQRRIIDINWQKAKLKKIYSKRWNNFSKIQSLLICVLLIFHSLLLERA